MNTARNLLLLCLLVGVTSTWSQSRTLKDSIQLVPLDDRQVVNLLTSLKGNVVVVNFWASWCKPCVIEFPHLVRLQKTYDNKDVKVVFISVDEREDADTFVRPFLRKQKVTFPTYIKSIRDDERFINAIGSGWRGAVPTTFVYDRRGKQVATLVGARSFAAFERVITPLLR